MQFQGKVALSSPDVFHNISFPPRRPGEYWKGLIPAQRGLIPARCTRG